METPKNHQGHLIRKFSISKCENTPVIACWAGPCQLFYYNTLLDNSFKIIYRKNSSCAENSII